jgi:hypothetical protein
MKSNVRMVALKVLAPPERQQRRASFRVETMVKAILRPYYMGPFPMRPRASEEDEMDEVPAYNISATGIAVRTKREYYVGDPLYARIFLAWPTPQASPLTVQCQVRQFYAADVVKKMYNVGLMFTDATEDLSSHIAKYVLWEEQRRVRQQKLVEDE